MYAQLPTRSVGDAACAFAQGSLIQRIPSKGLQAVARPAMEEFARIAPGFLALPREKQLPWMVQRSTDLEPDDGFMVRRGLDGGPNVLADFKLLFHYRVDSHQIFMQTGLNTAPYERLLDLCEPLRAKAQETALTLADGIGKIFPGIPVRERLQKGSALNVLRLLFYFAPHDPTRGKLGEPHFDRDFVTLHVAHSHPALSVDDGEETRMYDTEDDTSLVFFGKRARELLPAVIRPAKHWAHDGRAGDTNCRVSAVYFTHFDYQT